MFEMRDVIVLLFLAVVVGWSSCNTLVDTQEKDCSEEIQTLQIQTLQTDLKETRKALSQLILTLLDSREDADDLEDGGDVLVRKRRDQSSENEDILSWLPIGSLLGLRGKDGRDGVPGERGIPGETGRDGREGKDGKDGRGGAQGIAGFPGKDGKDGDDGKDGRDGIDGRDGAQGNAGIPGKDGKDGKDGDSAERGTPGEKGAAGTSGIPGKDGNDGRNGTPGIAGNPGEHVPPGEKGDTGTPGMPGQKGAPGISGIAGSPGMPGQRGEEGRSGTPGRDGLAGQPGRSIQNAGTVYTRWGRTSCGNHSTLIYSGFAAGSRHDMGGGGVNYQCMPPTPEYNTYRSAGYNSFLSGTEYQSHNIGLFPNQASDKNVPCARCYTNTRPAVMMLPAKRNCPTGWSREYEGYLMSEYYNCNHQSTFECVDSNPEYISGSSANTNGALFYFVKPICSGTATIHHCPPYVNGRQLTCVVCSK